MCQNSEHRLDLVVYSTSQVLQHQLGKRSFKVKRIRNVSLGGILLLREEGDEQKRGDASEPQQVKRKLEEKELRVLQNERRHQTLPFHYHFKKLHFTMLTKKGTLKLKNAVHKMTGGGVGWRVQNQTQHHCQNKTENIKAFQLTKIYLHSTPPQKKKMPQENHHKVKQYKVEQCSKLNIKQAKQAGIQKFKERHAFKKCSVDQIQKRKRQSYQK